MAQVVLIHGAFNELTGPHLIRSRWLPALRDGLWHHGVSIREVDVAVCFYGDLFRFDPEVDDPIQFTSDRSAAREALRAVAGDGAFDALGDAIARHTLDRTVDMLAILGQRPQLRDQIADRLAAALSSETRVVVAHSLGTVIAYLALARHPERSLQTLVTLGSPLATETARGQVQLGPDGLGAWPLGLGRWVNVAAQNDPVVAGTRLADVFGPRLEDHVIDNGHRPHDPEPYLSAATTGAAVAAALQA